jgi:uncharacterized protein YjbJ (UPF0337 family)
MISKNLTIRGDWAEIRGKLKQKYSDLTNTDLDYQEGREDELLGRLSKKLGKSREEVIMDINKLSMKA